MMSEGCTERTHYHFSHVLVPRLAFNDPEAFYQDLLAGSEALTRLWCALNSDTADAAPFRVTRSSDPELQDIFLIEMPRIDGDALAVAIAVVFEVVEPGTGAFPHRVRYFTLEKGPSLETGSPRHYLCEWEPDRGHANWGMLPGPDTGVFLSKVGSLTSSP